MQSIKESAVKTNQDAGDGTTTAIVLAKALIKEGFRLIETGVINPQELVSQMKEKANQIVDKIKELILLNL